MRHLTLLLLASAAMPAAAWAQAAPDLRDFSLPPSPRETAAPEVQGPVDDSAPVPVAPRVIRTPEARATAAPQPRPALRLPDAPPSAAAARAAPSVPPVAPTQPRPSSEPGISRVENRSAAPASPPSSTVQPQEPILSAPAAEPQSIDQSGPPPARAQGEPAGTGAGGTFPWLLLGALSLAGLAVGAWLWLRRRATARPVAIERPASPLASPANDDDRASAAALKVELAAVKLTRSFMNATLSYRVTLHNRSARVLTQLAIHGELIGAHGSQPLESQIASVEVPMPELHRLKRLALGQAHTVEGTLTLPLQAITPIRQGSAPLFVPLLRLLVTAEGAEPLARTFVVGQPGTQAGGRLQPFRLDEPPRSYQPIGQRALD